MLWLGITDRVFGFEKEVTMEVLEAIKTRRSIGKMEDQMVPKELIEQILEAGIWAPNRYLTEPWRFYVISGNGRNKLSKVMEEIVIQSGIDLESEQGKRKLDKERNKPFRAPVILAVAAEVTENEKVLRLEELGAVYAAIQNMLLAAHGLGLAAYWKTGKACYTPLMKEFFGLQEKDELLAFIYLGYADGDKIPPVKKPVSELTRWME
jgi:nitroreductase